MLGQQGSENNSLESGPPRLLKRKLNLKASALVSLGSMVGAGLFSAMGPATSAAGSWILVSLAAAALVATRNALSSAQLAVIYPRAGGTYVYDSNNRSLNLAGNNQ